MFVSPAIIRRVIAPLICGTLVCCVVASEVDASIIVPESFAVDASDLLKEADTCGSASYSGSNNQQQEPTLPEVYLQKALLGNLLGSSGSTSSTSTSSGSTGGSSFYAIDSSIAAMSPDLQLAGWFYGDTRWVLPAAPGNDLLRPPQQ